jgi:predicted RNase H-like nuclease
MPRIVGVDGCKAGWIASHGVDAASVTSEVFASIAALTEALPDAALVAIDMPIGLPETISGSGRVAEQAIRPHLGKRQSSLFAIPARAAIYAVVPQPVRMAELKSAHQTASEKSRSLSDPPRGVSFQTFNIFPRIRELDQFLIRHPSHRAAFREVHPEAAFWRMNGRKPLETPKKIKGSIHPAGMQERRRLLLAQGLDETAVNAAAPSGAALDDLIDSLAALAAAFHIAAGRGCSFPDPPERDAHGNMAAIWLWE